jgi:phosphomannomutase/phosphoglucomutase
MTIAKILEILAKEDKTLSDLISEIPKYEVYKTKMPCPNDKKELVMNALIEKIKCDRTVIGIDKIDGIKLNVKDGWVLMRPSGTEPIFRIYSESKSKEKAEKLAMFYKSLFGKIIASE